jgi:hypothetical protein
MKNTDNPMWWLDKCPKCGLRFIFALRPLWIGMCEKSTHVHCHGCKENYIYDSPKFRRALNINAIFLVLVLLLWVLLQVKYSFFQLFGFLIFISLILLSILRAFLIKCISCA